MDTALSAFLTDVLLRDGRTVTLRALRPTDADALTALGRALPAGSVRARFAAGPRPLDAEVADLMAADGNQHVVLTAWAGPTLAGMASYVREDPPAPGGDAEDKFAVSPVFQGRGVATLLLETLARIARPREIRAFDACVPRANRSMLSVFYDSGFSVDEQADGEILHVRLGLAASDAQDARSAARAQRAAAASLQAMLAGPAWPSSAPTASGAK